MDVSESSKSRYPLEVRPICRSNLAEVSPLEDSSAVAGKS